MNLPSHLDHSQNLNHLHSQIVMNSKTEGKNNDFITTWYISSAFVVGHNSTECSLMLD